MHKRWQAILIAAVLLLVAGCGKNAADPSAPPGGTATGGQAPKTNSPTGGSQGSGSGGASAGQAGSSQAGAGQQGAANQTAATVEKVSLGPLKAKELAQVGTVHVTLNEVVSVKKAGGLAPGYVYLLLNLTVKNEGATDYTLNVPDFAVTTPAGSKAPYNPQASTQRNPKLQGTVQPGQEVKGWLGFLAKAGSGDFTLKFTHPEFGEATWQFPAN